ncbi:lipopolysaccharide modification acyltransferase [Segatella salivae]|uniref:lipopolysaccharide modification acyltransferase n=1 Tax=Segatella salivae TaxID=228604 RepID=UPI00248DCE26|nr:lipopolysaccharide modification acyltransferase [Segatella salivae]
MLHNYSYIGINCIRKCTYQRRRCCAFDSPGLPNDSAGYPGLVYVVWGTTPSVLRFLCVICHESPCYNHAFIEKAQHLQR